MKKIITFIILLSSFILNSYGQKLSDAIKNMPENIIWGITAEQKDEILTNPTDSVISVTGNNLYNKYIRKEISDSYVRIQTSEVSDVQIKLLPLINNTNIICVVKTVCKDLCDSNISFYTMEWSLINDVNLFPQSEIDWFLKIGVDKLGDSYKNAIAAIDILPIKLSLEPNSNSIQAELDIKKYLDEKSYDDLKPYLKDTPQVFTWNKTQFK